MGILDETGFVERPAFFNGQRLFDSDLQALEAFNREMRWLHNQSLHQPGIGRGLAVSCILEAPTQAVDVMVKISARINPAGAAKGEALEVFWEVGGRWHLGPVDQEWDDSDVSGKRLSDLEPNKIARIINTARTIW